MSEKNKTEAKSRARNAAGLNDLLSCENCKYMIYMPKFKGICLLCGYDNNKTS